MDTEQPTQATQEQAPVEEQAQVPAAAVADAETAQPETKAPDYGAQIAELTAKLTESESRRKGQDRALTRMQKELTALRAGSPEAAALRTEMDAMRTDIAGQVDPNSPDSATSKARAQAQAALSNAPFIARRAQVMEDIAEKLSDVGIAPDANGIMPRNEDTEDIAEAVDSGEYALAKRLTKELVDRKKAVKVEAQKPAAKTYTQEEVDKLIAARLEAATQKANKNGLRESGLIDHAAATGRSAGDRLSQLENKDTWDLTPAEVRELASLKSGA